eukprot:9229527-Prorocentrum_lima.AAC.1
MCCADVRSAGTTSFRGLGLGEAGLKVGGEDLSDPSSVEPSEGGREVEGAEVAASGGAVVFGYP